MAIWLTYNGSGLISHNGFTLYPTQAPPPPTPEPIPVGAIRWQFHDDILQTWDDHCRLELNRMTDNFGSWSPVYDTDTGEMIPGMYDWAGDTRTVDFRHVFGSSSSGGGLNSLIYPCDLVDANVSSIGSNYWTDAFEGVTKLATATIKTSMGTPYISSYSTCNRMFYDCDSVTSIYLHMPSWLDAGNFNTPILCDNLTSLTLVSDATTMPIASTPWMSAPVLQELTLICTNPSCTAIVAAGNLLGYDTDTRTSIRKVTIAAPSPTAYIGGGYGDSSTANHIFKDCINLQSVKQYATYGLPDPSRWTEVPLRLAGAADEAFYNCPVHVDLDLSGVTRFDQGFAYSSGFVSDNEIISYYKQLLRKFPDTITIRTDNDEWFTGVTMSRATAACILSADGGTLNYRNIAGGSGLRFRFLDTHYNPGTSSASNNGTWTAVDPVAGVWDWSGTTGATDGQTSAFSMCLWGINYIGNLRHGVNDCVLIACGTGYSPERTAHAFQNCSGLIDVIHPFNLSTSAKEAFSGCTHLTDMPIIKNANVADCTRTFYGDVEVQGHVVDTYNRLSATAMSYTDCFTNCGPESERAQIPTSWGGTAT